MSDDKTSKKKGGRSKKWILLSALILVLGGMGAAGGFFAAGMLGGHANAATEDPNRPKLVLKGEGAPAGEGEKAEPVIGTVAGDGSTPKDASKYQATYYQIEAPRSEEHTSELQSLMRISYAVFCLKKKRT